MVSRHSGVVGKPDRPTPIAQSAIHELNFNPVWHLPPTVIEKDLIPKGQDMATAWPERARQIRHRRLRRRWQEARPDQGQLERRPTQGLTYRQQPGPDNPLGFVKINFHNAHSVYMHDTPSAIAVRT